MNRYWSDEEKQFILDNAMAMTPEEISEALKRPIHSVRQKITRLGAWSGRKGTPWTKEQVNYLKDHWKDFPASEIALALGRPETAIHAKVKHMKLPAKNKFYTPEQLIQQIANYYLRYRAWPLQGEGVRWNQETQKKAKMIGGLATPHTFYKQLGPFETVVKPKVLEYLNQK